MSNIIQFPQAHIQTIQEPKLITQIAKEQAQAIEGLSRRYSHVDSIAIHNVLRDNGFTEAGYKQAGVKKQEKIGFQKHMSIFNRQGMTDGSDGNFNVLLMNSHDGTSAVRIELGYFRLVCENQLINSEVGLKVTHKGDVLEKLNQGIPLLLKAYEDYRALKEQLTSITLSEDQVRDMLTEALRIRELDGMQIEDEALKNKMFEYNLSLMNRPKRKEDVGNIAWSVLNRIQEKVIRGSGDIFMNQSETGSIVYRKLRAVNNIDRVIRYNKQLSESVIEITHVA